MKANRGGLPIFVQLLALAVLCLVSVQLVNLAGVLFLPDPPPEGFSIADAAKALQGHPVVTPSGHRLLAEVTSHPPAFATRSLPIPVITLTSVGAQRTLTKRVSDDNAQDDPLNPVVAEALAQALNVEPDRVRVQVHHPQPHFYRAVDMASTHDEITRHMREHTRLVIQMSHATVLPDQVNLHMGAVMKDAALFPPFAAALKLPDGRWSVITPPHPLLSAWQIRMMATFTASALIVILIAWFAARRLARPIHAFAGAAERLGADPQAPPLTFQGPAEVRTAVAAFNEMQDKLRRYVNDRTLMIASIAHDLRTPLTRLRFRIEGAPLEIRDRVAADIEQMDGMISAALAYARGETRSAERARLDLTALVSSVVEDMRETGAKVGFDAGAPVLVFGDALGLKRVVVNLIDNAVKFADAASLSLSREDGKAILRVDDAGCGLPADELERVFEPFYRTDAARSTTTGGFGLGLATARTIARAHGGDVTLSNRPGGGLRAETVLPALG
ncbi:MAG TPA: ATP-binding protein [Caulobacteraceae bacterium]|jgi:signal transduction histidine kinase|nr:ATP-binding protein [Caulobacteraceae bacterium]